MEPRPGGGGSSLHEFAVFRRKAVVCSLLPGITDLHVDTCHLRLTQTGSRFDQSIEHRLEIEGRTADDLKHIGGRGLLLKRFAQLVEQSRVLDGDDRLGSEILN